MIASAFVAVMSRRVLKQASSLSHSSFGKGELHAGSPVIWKMKPFMDLTRLVVINAMLGLWAVGTSAAAEPTSASLPERNPQRVSAPALPAPKPAAPQQQETPPLPTRKAAVARPSAETPPLPVPKSRVAKDLVAPAITRLPSLLEYDLIETDAKALRESIRASYAERYDDARRQMASIKDKTAHKLALWYYYRSKGLDAEANAIEAFRSANPDWPNQNRLRNNAEEALFAKNADPETVKSFFSDSDPVTGAGKAALGGAYLADGEESKALSLIRDAWRNHEMSKELESEFIKRFSDQLSAEDHKTRADRFLYADRRSKLPAALRAAAHLNDAEKKKIEARAAVVRRSKTAEKLLKAVPEEAAKGDTGFYFSRIQWLRRNDKDAEAWKLLLAAPQDPAVLVDPEEWWIERRINCRNALDANEPRIAYEIVKNHSSLSGEPYAQAKFLAGWIALRYLGEPDAAEKHFLALRTAVSKPRLIARAEYWLGRTASVLGLHDQAKAHYRNAGKYIFTFYGQLALQALGPGSATLEIPSAPIPAMEDFQRFKERDAVRAIAVLRAAGFENLAPLFFHQLARTLESPGEIVLLARLALLMDQAHASVRLAKIALNRGMPAAEYAYPTGMLPLYKELSNKVELPFLYALSRQESEFNPSARSPAGARGMMQLMPGTARAIARQHNVRYHRSRLTEASYNMMLGVAHLGDLLEEYNGSYLLTLVAYNAGPRRVTEWTETFGDPRNEKVDPVDWVERVPFTETRKYIQKILMSLQIFRSRLTGPEGALRLMEDLNRGKKEQGRAMAVPVQARN